VTKIRNKLLFAFILISLIPLIIVGGYALTNISSSLKSVHSGKLNDKVTIISSQIEDFLKNVSNDLFYLRDSITLHTMLSDSRNLDSSNFAKKKLEEDFLAFSRHQKIYNQIRFLDVSGMEIVRVDRNHNESAIVALERLQNKKKRYYFADTAELTNGQLMISPLDLNRECGKVEKPLRPVIRYGTPVYDKNNQFRGIVLFNVIADKFLELVRQNNAGHEQLLFIDNDGFFYSHPNAKKEWGRESDLNTGISFKTEIPEAAKQVVGSNQMNTLVLNENIIAASPVYLDREKNVILGNIIDIVPIKDVFSSITMFRNIFLAISAVVFALTLVLAITLAKSITDPIVYLTRTTEAMSKGTLSSSVTVTTKDETKLLAEAIERLRKSMIILLKRK
jgi:HAMP domain-containing protein